ncbi:HlyD family secretion protein [Sulfurimonas sp. MAG313]|nr:HlyD family secretion protein [Sulfurimonas sp. MAG313]MDF1879763.1 HlyD family secretion protein [Sulfurimonas sp. MAG313]
MKKIIIYMSLTLSLMGAQYYSKVQPYELYTLQSNVSGLIVKSDINSEGKVLGTRAFIKIDDEIDQKERQLLKVKKTSLEKSLVLNNHMAENLSEMIEKKKINYERIKNLPIKSSVEKDKEFFDLSTTLNLELSTLEKIETIHAQLSDTQLRLEQLKRFIQDKEISAPNMVLYKLYVKKGQVVSPGMNLADVADVSKAKLTIFLNANELEKVQSLKIYLNDIETSYKIDKIWPLSDTEHISSYKTEILIKAPAQFSKLYKIEFK